ncbi:MAG: hypothetical protein EXS12_02230 [Phycisphaerales bacterium]|nr:hypothetical protein [Phycisphaerales bacterium]
MRDRIIQLICLCIFCVGAVISGDAVPKLLEQANKEGLRYTSDPVEGAPPIIALGTAIGALRGVLADYLWIKLQMQKDQGLFYEAMADADLITKLQPRFAEVWGFHGHNMAYNISVITNTPSERWAWVNAGIELVRNRGLRYNPNDLGLNKELAFWFAHKIDGVSDDAHLHYKREFAKEWLYILGSPPYDQVEREKWMRAIANAPDTVEELEQKKPDVKVLIEELTAEFTPFDKKFRFKLDKEFLINLGKWMAVKSSPYARILNLEKKFKSSDPIFVAFDRVLSKPNQQAALNALLPFLRKRALIDDYNMDPNKMADYTRDYGPLDWRHAQAHAFYWSRLGAEQGESRYGAPDNAYKVMNNDRLVIQAMQAMNNSGLVAIDPFSNDNPTRLQDNRWIKSIEKYFLELYKKHYQTRGAGGDTFCDFHENFMGQAIRQLFRVGDYAGAQEILDHLDQLYGRGGLIPNNQYEKSLEDFVRDATYGEYDMVPDVARTDVYAVLQRGFREGLLLGRKKILEESLQFAKDLTDYFQGNRYTDFVNKFGEMRMADLVGDIRRSVEDVLILLLRDNNQPLLDRLTIYNRASEEQRRMVYDAVKDQIAMELKASPLSEAIEFSAAFPEPPEMDSYRVLQAEAARVRKASLDNQNRSETQRK